MQLTFCVNEDLETSEVADLVRRTRVTRQVDDARRLVRIAPHTNVVVSVRDGGKLVGLARGLKELGGCCYVSDLHVDTAYAKYELGGALLRRVREAAGPNALIVLVPAPVAMAFGS